MEIAAITISLISILISLLSWKIQRNSEMRTNIADLISEYRSSEMYYAIKQLWDMYKKVGKNKDRLIKKYFMRVKNEDKNPLELESNPIEYAKKTIHHSRRIVVLYYLNVSQIVNRSLIRKDIFFNMWNVDDLAIISEIILPLQYALLEKENGKSHDDVTASLKILYNSAVSYHKKRDNKLLKKQNKKIGKDI